MISFSPGRTWLPGCRRPLASVAAALFSAGIVATAGAQTGMPKPQSYTDFYKQQRQQTHTTYMTPRQYTYNKYFYHNPAISPYSNLMRPTGQYTPKYQTYVRPEQQRRAAQAQPQLVQQPSLRPAPQSQKSSPYYSKYFNNGMMPR